MDFHGFRRYVFSTLRNETNVIIYYYLIIYVKKTYQFKIHCKDDVLILVLCDTWNRSDDNDTVSGIAILDTTAIPEMRYGILMFFRNRQSHILVHVITEMCVSSFVSTVCTLARLSCCVYCMKCAPASVNTTRSQAVARIADRTSSQHFGGSRHRPHVTWLFDTHMPFPIGFPLD